MPVIFVLIDVDIFVHPSAIGPAEATVEATDKAGEERNDPEATEAITTKTAITTTKTAIATAAEGTAEEVFVQVLVVVDILVDVLVIVIGERLVSAEPEIPLSEAALVLEETGVLERNVVVNVEVGVIIDSDPETVQAMRSSTRHSIAAAPVAALFEEVVEPAEIGHQILVGVDVLVDVLVVVIIKRTTVEATAAAAAEAAEAAESRTLRLLKPTETTETTVASAGLLRVFFVYIPVIIDVLVNVMTEIIAVGFEFCVDDVRQT